MEKKKIKYKSSLIESSDDKYINLPYNRKNILITEDDVYNLLKPFNINAKIVDLKIFQTALTHKSYINKNFEFTREMLDECDDYVDSISLQNSSYEMMEFYGDTVAEKIIVKYLCDRYPEEDEGVLTKLKTNIVDTKSFSKFARKIGLTPYIIISKQVENIDNGIGRESIEFRKILEDVFEAFLGAMDVALIDVDHYNFCKNANMSEYMEYKKTYRNPCDKLIINLLETEIDFAELFYNDTNYKNRLLQYYHKMRWGDPHYVEGAHNGPPHKCMFTMYVVDNNGQYIGTGVGKRKKDGEQIAAMQALIKFGEIDPEDVINITADMYI